MRRVLAILLAVLLLPIPGAPLVRAEDAADAESIGWNGGGRWEPGTQWDDASVMWQTPDHAWDHDVRRVFLDAHFVQRGIGDLSTNKTGTPGVTYQIVAYFGVWKDCNRDGYIGEATTGLLEYPATDAGICTANPAHVAGNVIREFLWATPASMNQNSPSEIVIPDLQVWADYGDPNAPNTAATPKTQTDFELTFKRTDITLQNLPAPKGIPCGIDACRAWTSPVLHLALPDTNALVEPTGPRASATASPHRTGLLTTYAQLQPGGENAQVPSPSPFLYGGGPCPNPSPGQPPVDGWACDPTEWTPNGPSPGTPYRLRDVDVIHLADTNTYYQPDDNNDELGDPWNRIWQIVNRFNDPDQDQANSLLEYRWLTQPMLTSILGATPDARDTDGDAWMDGPEIRYWDAHDDTAAHENARLLSIALIDPDARDDNDGDGIPNQLDNDSDNDTLPDGAEAQTYGTYPEYQDSDCTPQATTCTRVSDTRYQSPDRLGSPGTGDGIPDAQEVDYWVAQLGPGGYAMDCDADGIANILDPDSDNDGLLDGEEINPPGGTLASNPCNGDTDNDGLLDGDERTWLTDPQDPDTDNDGLHDGWEVKHNFDPRFTNDATLDVDLDELTNIQEQTLGTDPRDVDTDNDELLDGNEALHYHTSPIHWDTDHDGMPDGWEQEHLLDPLDPADAEHDTDADNYDGTEQGYGTYTHANLDEYQYARPGHWNEAINGTWRGGTNPQSPDTDQDGAWDAAEIYHGTHANDTYNIDQRFDPRDPDRDGLTTTDELAIGTQPARPDTDGDGLCDGGRAQACHHPTTSAGGPGGAPGERDYQTSPLHMDTDADGLNDGIEITYSDPQATGQAQDTDADGRTDPLDGDADDDGLTDGKEWHEYGTNFRMPDTDLDGLTDSEELDRYRWTGHEPDPLQPDTDGDGLFDGEEVRLGTNVNKADTDEDGLTDAMEISLGTDPFHQDTDQDGMPDGWEVEHFLDPRLDDAQQDPDHDGIPFGLTNLQEYLLGTDPHNNDTDVDTIDDGWEVQFGLDPNANDLELDSDHDGLPNIHEYILKTTPSNPDTDRDGLNDGWEAGTKDGNLLLAGASRTNATLRDTDEDGIDDGRELDLWNQISPTAWLTDYDNDAPLAEIARIIRETEATETELRELLAHNLRDADSDGDGLDDGQEFLTFHTRPDRKDTDADGDSDYHEIWTYGTNPNDPDSNRRTIGAADANLDSDEDGLNDHEETSIYDTDPFNADTDADGFPDGAERNAWGNDWNLDIDNDGRHALQDDDGDGDGVNDLLEFGTGILPRNMFHITSPWLWDTDDDGLSDGQEDDNGLIGQAAATTRTNNQYAPIAAALATLSPTLSTWWTGIDTQGPYIDGAYGTRFTSTGTKQWPTIPPMPGVQYAGAANGNKPAPGKIDTDDDGLTDGEEYGRSDWSKQDSDDDGVLDTFESWMDTDRDGTYDIMDPDSDDDGLLDGQEDTNGNGLHDDGETDSKDADTDDDALCDGEEQANPNKHNPLDPDTDDDGLSDGREMFRQTGCTTTHRADWTNTNKPLELEDRVTFQAYKGPLTVADIPIDANGKTPVEVLDFDEDGIPDGLEDLNADGLLNEGETEPLDADSDDDGLPDGVELRIFGPIRLAYMARIYQSMGLSLADAMTWDPLASFETDARDNDTDTDGILDGQDIGPKENAVFEFRFDSYEQLEKVDVGGGGPYAPELVFEISLETVAGVVGFETITLPEMVAKPGHPVDLQPRIGMAEIMWNAGSKLADDRPLVGYGGTQGGLVTLDIIDQIQRLGTALQGADQLGEITVTIRLRDDDFFEDDSDVIDISPKKLQSDLVAKINVLQSAERGYVGLIGDGSVDRSAAGNWFDRQSENYRANQEDDGKLKVSMGSNIIRKFVQNVIAVKNSGIPPTQGQCFGFGGC